MTDALASHWRRLDEAGKPLAVALFAELRPFAKSALAAVNELRFHDSRGTIERIRGTLNSARTAGAEAEDEYLNDISVLEAYADPCYCGSGKKLKECCLSRGHVERPANVAAALTVSNFFDTVG